MALKIEASNLASRHYLVVRSDGVALCDSAFSSETRHRFADIECVLLGPDNRLSIQAGTDIFSIEINPDNPKHQEVIASLVQEIKRAGGQWEPPD